MLRRPRAPIPVRSGRTEFLKINAARRDWHDGYHWVLSLTWPQFALFLVLSYITVNLVFATLYCIGDGIADLTPGSFPQAFFFSVETLATVGYGHNYPATVYGHVVVTIEIFLGMIWLAVITGLIFVRFSRPTARILFSRNILIGNHDGRPTLMFRVANLRHTSMADARFRLLFSRDETVLEGEDLRRFYALKVFPEHMIRFPAALTIRHTIDEHSPLYGETVDSLAKCDAFFVASVTSIETVMAASVQSAQDYSYDDIRWGERFVDIYEEREDGRLQVDYGRIHDTEPVPTVAPAEEPYLVSRSKERVSNIEYPTPN
jgi:inward rectifier potassium channel